VTASQAAPPAPRKLWLDWQRGLAVLFMIQWHVLDGWRAPDAIPPGGAGLAAFEALRWIGGLAAPGFLYMAGLSQALADDALERRGLDSTARRRRALRRALEILAIAWGVRIVLYLLSYWKPGALLDLLKVDVLDVIALGLAVGALTSVGRPRGLGAAVAGAAGLAVVLATPLVAAALHHLDGPGGPWRAPGRPADVGLAWLFGSQPRAVFCAFNWVAFALAGSAAAPLARSRRRPLAWLALAAACYAVGWATNRMPDVYAYQDFWHTSPSWFLMRLGLVLGLTAALQAVPDAAERVLRWLTLLGRQSLVAYVASVNLTYGAIAVPVKGKLTLGGTVAGMVLMAALTWAICTAWERLQAFRRSRFPRREGPRAAAA